MNDNLAFELLGKELFTEWKEDLSKQCIVLMGLPASGKTTFTKDYITKYIPGVSGFSVTNSDNNQQALQHSLALSHYDYLKKQNITTQQQIDDFIKLTQYRNNDGTITQMPLTLMWWDENMGKGPEFFYRSFILGYYGSYFDLRDIAKDIDKTLWDDKVVHSANMIAIDTVASKPDKIFKRLKQARDKGYVNNVIYLKISPELCVSRDEYRKKHFGRGVGTDVIFKYVKDMPNALKQYEKEAKKPDGLVDRILQLVWIPQGDSPKDGTWKLVSDVKYYVQRKVDKYKLDR